MKTGLAAARTDAGEHRESDAVHESLHKVVVELHGDDVVLARESGWRGRARSELPTVRPKAATAALVEDEAWTAIGGQQEVDEHE
jgi:hypothetical protein